MNIFNRGNILLLFLILGAAIIVLFPSLAWYPQGSDNLDNSWAWANRYALEQHFRWGVDYIFTYGPLGFLNTPCTYGSYGLWVMSAMAALLSVALTLWILVRANLKSAEGAWSPQLICELVICVLITQICGREPQTAFLLCGYALLCFSLVQEESVPRAFLIAFLFAVSALMKGSAMLEVFVLIAVNLVAAALSGNRGAFGGAIRLAISFPFFFLVLWVASWQPPYNLPVYIYGCFEIASGYTKTMGIDGDTYQVVFALLFLALYLAGVIFGCRRTRVQAAMFLLTVPVLFLYWKVGFVRQNPVMWGGGGAILFYTVLPFVFWINYLVAKKIAPAARDLFLAGALSCLALIYVISPSSSSVFPVWNPDRSVSLAQTALQAAIVDDPVEVQKKINTDLRNSYNLPQNITGAFEGVPTMVLPWDLVLAPAYRQPPAIPPVPQIYSIYTPYLDGMQADWLAQTQPPQILFTYRTIDNRYPLFEGPSFSYRILRQYSVVTNNDTYALLRRNQVDDLGIKWQGSPQTVHFDQEVSLPSAGEKQHVLMKATPHLGFLGNIYGFFYKTACPKVIFHLKDGTDHSFNFVYTTGGDGLLVSHFVNDTLQYAQLSKLALAPNVRSISFSIDPADAWQFAGDFPVEFGTADVTEGIVRSLPSPLAVDESWNLQSSIQKGEYLTETRRSQEIPVVKISTSCGFVDQISRGSDNQVHIRGWAGDSGTGEASTDIVIVTGAQVVKVKPVTIPRPDVAQNYRQPDMTLCGFEFEWSVPSGIDKSKPMRVFGFVKGQKPEDARLMELEYNTVGAQAATTTDKGLSLAMMKDGIKIIGGDPGPTAPPSPAPPAPSPTATGQGHSPGSSHSH